jgi:hypothetical protein
MANQKANCIISLSRKIISIKDFSTRNKNSIKFCVGNFFQSFCTNYYRQILFNFVKIITCRIWRHFWWSILQGNVEAPIKSLVVPNFPIIHLSYFHEMISEWLMMVENIGLQTSQRSVYFWTVFLFVTTSWPTCDITF